MSSKLLTEEISDIKYRRPATPSGAAGFFGLVQNGVIHRDFMSAIVILSNELIINGYLQEKMASTK